MNRVQMGLLAWIGVIIVLGLLLIHGKETAQLAGTTTLGISNLIHDLQHPEANASH